MTRHLVESEEAHWTGPERYWASVQQFPARRSRLAGHIVAAIIGAGLALAMLVLEFGK